MRVIAVNMYGSAITIKEVTIAIETITFCHVFLGSGKATKRTSSYNNIQSSSPISARGRSQHPETLILEDFIPDIQYPNPNTPECPPPPTLSVCDPRLSHANTYSSLAPQIPHLQPLKYATVVQALYCTLAIWSINRLHATPPRSKDKESDNPSIYRTAFRDAKKVLSHEWSNSYRHSLQNLMPEWAPTPISMINSDGVSYILPPKPAEWVGFFNASMQRWPSPRLVPKRDGNHRNQTVKNLVLTSIYSMSGSKALEKWINLE